MRESEALAQGYIIDDSCNPKVAYKGPRFNPSLIIMLEPQGGYQDVADFNTKFDVPTAPALSLLSREKFEYRLNFLNEELIEFQESHEKGDLTTAVDSLIDLVYVAYGTAQMMGVTGEQWKRAWDEVQRANMSKVRVTDAGQSKRKTSLDVIKPEGWKGPDHRFLGEAPWPAY